MISDELNVQSDPKRFRVIRKIQRMLVLMICFGGTTILLISGCNLLTDNTAGKSSSDLLKPIPRQLDAINMNIVFVERLKNDPLIGTELWREIDQIATIAPEQRQKLRELGISVGVTGSQPSRTMQRLLDMKTEITDLAGTSREHILARKETILPSGSSTQIQTSIVLPKIEFKNCPSARLKDQTLTNVRCQFNVKAERLQDGWVKMTFIPEIHHGYESIRPRPGNSKFELKESQDIIPLYDYKFEVTISLGEMVIIGKDPESDDTLADSFFTGENVEGITSRVIVLRLVDMQSLDPIYQESSYNKY